MKDRREVDDINSPDAELGGRRNPLESNGGGGGYGYVFSVYDYGYALNSLAMGNYSSIDEFMYAQFSSGNGRYVPLNGVAGEGVSVMIGDVSCYGRYSYSSSGSGFSSSDYSFTMKSQGDFHTCSGRTRGGGGSGGSGSKNGGNLVNGIGVVQYVANDLLNAPYKQAKRVDGRPKPVSVNVLNRAKSIKLSRAVGLCGKIGYCLPIASVLVSVNDGFNDHWQNHNYLDTGISVVLAVGAFSPLSPFFAVAGIAYFGIDFTHQIITGKTLTEYVD